MKYETLEVHIENKIARLSFNRPDKANALNDTAWKEMKAAFEAIDESPEVRLAILNGKGKHFCSGIDISLLMSIKDATADSCDGRMREKLRKLILTMQDTVTAIEKCSKPVIAAIHGGCIGGGLDIIAACDMRYCTEDAFFTIKEIDMGMVADLGTLQRLPKIISPAVVNELAFTGRNVGGLEAKEIGLVNRYFSSKEILDQEVLKIATQIASKSPLSIRGIKHMIQYSKNHSIEDSLNYMATWNASMLISEDLIKAFEAKMSGNAPEFRD